MKITYRTKQKYGKGYYGTSIQVDFDKQELTSFQKLADELIALGFTYTKSPFPIMLQSGHQATFYKNGSKMFGLQTEKEHIKMVEESLPILKKFEPSIVPSIRLYDND